MSLTYDEIVAAETNLLLVAESINDARRMANANEATAPQWGVYGYLSAALKETLARHFDATLSRPFKGLAVYAAEEVYQLVIDNGESVDSNVSAFLAYGFRLTSPIKTNPWDAR